jgi:dihydrofolate reductase
LLLGRKTYEIFAAFWPHVTDENDPVATKLNSLPKYVASKTLDTVEWNNSTLIKGDVAEEVAKLKRKPGQELQVHGSGELAQTLMRHDLVDEYRLWIYPVVLGSGRRLFGGESLPAALKLVDTKTTGTGVVIHVYQPAGKPVFGSFALEEGRVSSTEALGSPASAS